LIVAGIIIGVGLMCTGIGMLGVLCAGAVTAGDGAKIGRTDTQVADTLSQEQTANGKRLASEVSPEDDARMLAQMRAEEIAPRKPTRCSEGMMRISQWVFVQPSNVSAPANVTSSTNRLG
jgi:hypothetical protein